MLTELSQLEYAQLASVIDSETWRIAVPVLDAKKRAVSALGVVPLKEVRHQALVPALQAAARSRARRMGEVKGNRFRSMESA